MAFNIVIFTLLLIAVRILATHLEHNLERPEITIELLHKGFHRDLNYEIKLSSNWAAFGCNFILSQQFPKGIYVNVDQLDDLVRLKQLNAVYPRFVDVEVPARDASPFHVYFNLTSEEFQTITLPIHFRYQSPGIEDYVDVELELPRVYGKCKYISVACGCGPNLCVDERSSPPKVRIAKGLDKMPPTCDWSQISVTTVLQSSLKTEIPIGNIALYQPVVFVTLIIGWIGLVYTLVFAENTYLISEAKLQNKKIC